MEQQGTGVIIVAGGSGSRLGGPLPKQFRMLGSLPVLGHAINAFARTLHSTQIVVVLPEGQIDFWKNLAARFDIAKHTCTAGGPQRFHSVRNGLSALPRTVALIAVHDGVRPLVSSDLILKAVECAAAHGTAIPVVEAVDSLRQAPPHRSHRFSSHPTDRTRSTAIRCESYKRPRSSTRNCSVVPMNSTTPPTSPTTPRSSNGRDMRSRSATESAAT